MSDRDVEAMKKLYDDQIRRGVARATGIHTYRSSECVHDRHPGCVGHCRYCPAQCDCPCHLGS